jgi:hypothetical protein
MLFATSIERQHAAARLLAALLAPPAICSAGLVVSQSMHPLALLWVQLAALLVAIATGFALLPPIVRRRPILAGLIYIPLMLWGLLYFALWFVAYFYGLTI